MPCRIFFGQAYVGSFVSHLGGICIVGLEGWEWKMFGGMSLIHCLDWWIWNRTGFGNETRSFFGLNGTVGTIINETGRSYTVMQKMAQ